MIDKILETEEGISSARISNNFLNVGSPNQPKEERRDRDA